MRASMSFEGDSVFGVGVSFDIGGLRDSPSASLRIAVIPAKAGIHFDPDVEAKMDSGFRRNDG
jgi:hypothetical protein